LVDAADSEPHCELANGEAKRCGLARLWHDVQSVSARNYSGNPIVRGVAPVYPALASTTGARIVEVPIENLERKAGRSNYGISRTIRVFLDLVIVKFLLDYSTRPLQFFGLLGMAGAGSGVLIGGYVLFEKFYYHMAVMQQHGPLMLLSIALLVSGIQFISMGLLGEIMARTYYESQNKPIYALREVKSHRKEMGDPAEPARPSGNTER